MCSKKRACKFEEAFKSMQNQMVTDARNSHTSLQHPSNSSGSGGNCAWHLDSSNHRRIDTITTESMQNQMVTDTRNNNNNNNNNHTSLQHPSNSGGDDSHAWHLDGSNRRGIDTIVATKNSTGNYAEWKEYDREEERIQALIQLITWGPWT